MLSGLGAGVQPISQDIGLASSAASITAGALALPSVGILAGAAVPVVGLAIAGGALVATLIANVFSGCGSTCTLTSDMANQIEPLMQQNLAEYQASDHSPASQSTALANFDYLWSKLVQYCQQSSMGNAGKNCISDRQAGSCKWRDSTGNCWNWFSGYRDPIANDPTVKANSTTVSSVISTVVGGGTILDLLIPGALIIGGLVLSGE